VSNDYIQEWINQDEEQQLTDYSLEDLVNHAADGNLGDNNGGPEKADRIGHSEGLNSVETAPAYIEQQKEAVSTY
jgi:hypothetical protein